MDFNTIGSISAIFIALCALGVSIWQGYETRNNYRLSVTPKLEFIVNWTIGERVPGITITNKGLGPATITKCEIELEGQFMSVLNYYEIMRPKFFIQKQKTESLLINICDLSFNSTLAANEDNPFIWLSGESGNDFENIKYLQEVVSEINIKIEYKSVYNKKYSLMYNR